ncbi:MAG: MATE family efflux transporter [Planctomycetia bacterium]|nr:MATE family efflux transporter [Planctomycetia bacterium]
MDHSKALGTEPIFRLLFHYSVPAVIGMLVQVLYTIVDAAFIGHYQGPDGLAAVTLAFPMTVISTGFSLLVGAGTCSIVSLLLGQRRLEEAERILGNAVSMTLVFGVLMVLFVFTISDYYIDRHTNLNADVLQMAKTFLRITMGFAFLPAIAYGLNNLIRVQGNPRIAMATLLVGTFLNIVLNPIFIGYFQWGVAGSAWATVISLALTAVWVIYYFRSSRSLLTLRWKNLKLNWNLCKPILTIGLAPFLTQLASSFQGIVLVGQLAQYGGDNAVAIWGVIYRIVIVIFLVVLGLYQGAQPIMGYNFGAKQYQRVKQVLLLSIGIACVWCFGVSLIAELFPVMLVRLFTQATPELDSLAKVAIRLSLLMTPLMGFQVISSHYFQAVGKPKLSIFLSLTRQFIILIPLLIVIPRIWGLIGIWSSFAISDFLSAFLTFLFIRNELRNLDSGKQSLSILSSIDNLEMPP